MSLNEAEQSSYQSAMLHTENPPPKKNTFPKKIHSCNCQTLLPSDPFIHKLKHCGAQSKLCPRHHFTICFHSKSHCEGLSVNTVRTNFTLNALWSEVVLSDLFLSLSCRSVQQWATLSAAYFCCCHAFFCPALMSRAPTVSPWRLSNCRPYPAMTKRWGSCRVWPSPTSTRTAPTDTNLPWTALQMSTCTLRSVAPAAGSQHCRPPAVLVIPPQRVFVRCLTGEVLRKACFLHLFSCWNIKNSSAVKRSSDG